jgi:hypothetical protein
MPHSLLDALHEGVEARSTTVSGQVTIVEQVVGVNSNVHVFIAAATVAAKVVLGSLVSSSLSLIVITSG